MAWDPKEADILQYSDQEEREWAPEDPKGSASFSDNQMVAAVRDFSSLIDTNPHS